jgi:hypothetical protein
MLKKSTRPLYACPHCDQPCISFWRKQALGPATSATCRSCGKAVSVGPGALMTMLPILAAFITGRYLELPAAGGVALLLGGAVLSGLLSHHFVRLVRR